MFLHLLQIDTPNNSAINDCLLCLTDEDSVVIVTDLNELELQEVISKLIQTKAHLQILYTGNLHGNGENQIEHIGYPQLIALTYAHNKTISWY